MEAAVLGPVAVRVVDHLLQYLRSVAENPRAPFDAKHKALKDGLDGLLALRKDKEDEALSHIMQRNTSEIYKHWKGRVSDIKEKVASLDTKCEQVKGNIWKFLEKMFLECEIKRAINDVIAVVKECPKEFLVDKLPVEPVKEETGVPSIDKYPTLKKAYKDIQALLMKRNEIKCVALRGQKGVGKTTIMQHLNNKLCDDIRDNNLKFDVVIFIKVAADERTKEIDILQKIADRMRVDGEGDELEVAERIKRVLKDKRYLLILDGVRQNIDGIWNNLDIPKDEKDSKVIITTSYPLAWKSARVQRIVELKTLSPDEAWQMFQGIVGDNLLPDIPNAELVCQRFCCCLPLLIDLIARSFKVQESPPDWQRALNERTPWPQVEVDGLQDLYLELKNCYQQLGDRTKQKCFLYASLYPANSKIYTQYLVECYIVQGFLGDARADAKYNEMRMKVKNVLWHLVNVAFLEEREHMRYVEMNDLYRQLALHISSKDSNSQIKTYVVDNDEHEKAFRSTSYHHRPIWVSMVGGKKESLPASKDFSSLQALLLQKNLKLKEISGAHLNSMSNLLVLNLYGTKITKLPSLARLTRLKAFYINGCLDLEIGFHQFQPLQDLQVLDIRGTRINYVPCLKSMRCLRMSYTESGDYRGFSKLKYLEELTIEIEERLRLHWNTTSKQIFVEVASLKGVTFVPKFKRWGGSSYGSSAI